MTDADNRKAIPLGFYLRTRDRMVHEARRILYPLTFWLYAPEEERKQAEAEIRKQVDLELGRSYRIEGVLEVSLLARTEK